MKTKSILFAIVALALLSFTFVSKQTKETIKADAKQTSPIHSQAKGGLAMEDKW